jgi:hypothetical protein
VRTAGNPDFSAEWLRLMAEWSEAEAIFKNATPGTLEAEQASLRMENLKAKIRSVVARGGEARVAPSEEFVLGFLRTNAIAAAADPDQPAGSDQPGVAASGQEAGNPLQDEQG